MTAKVTKDKDQPVESPQLMRAENRLKHPDDLTDGDADYDGTGGAFLV